MAGRGEARQAKMFDITDKTIIVGGGSGLIGQEIIETLQKLGAEVINADINDEKKPIDLSKDDAIRSLLSGHACDVFANCSYLRNYFRHFNLFLSCTQMFSDHMAQNGGGSIINFASIYGVKAPDYSIYGGTNMDMPTEYGAVKAGIIQMTRIMAVKHASKGVRINCISPGGVFDNQDERFVEKYCNNVPMGRMAMPKDIVGAVVFLASDESKYITGQNIAIDGGLTCK